MCYQCETSGRIGYKFCPQCGQKVNQHYKAPKLLECSNCHTKGTVEPKALPIGACPSCGSPTQCLLMHLVPLKPTLKTRAKSGAHPPVN